MNNYVALSLALWSVTPGDAGPLGLRVPPGFEVTEFAGNQLADDIIRMTLDPKGRIVVAGRGYIRILIDENGDGRADRAVEFANGPKDGAMGMLWEGDTLYVTGDGGLRRYEDKDGDGKADGPSELIRAMKTGGEHTAHEIRRGPDGWLYVLCGDGAGIDKSFATRPTSPIKEPNGGGVVRFSPDFKDSEIIAHGFRNAYGMDFDAAGELFTFDSDNERCVSLPWYEPTRFYHVIEGGHHGWLGPQKAAWFRLPPYLPDVIAPVATLGRGSPTGVACYRHVQFPEKYRGGMFALDWTFGKVWFVPLVRSGATYTSKPEPFVEAIGDNGFAPTDAVVHPATGDLYVSIGGRGTRGAVYRVRYPKGQRAFSKDEIAALQPTTRPHSKLPVEDSLQVGDTFGAVLGNRGKTARTRLWATRMLQIELGDLVNPSERGSVWAGYSPRVPQKARELAGRFTSTAITTFPTDQLDLDRELSRLLAMIEADSPALLERVAGRFTADADPLEDIHYLIVLARLKGQRSREVTAKTAGALLLLDRKLALRKMQRDTHWPLRIGELYDGLAKKDPRLHAALVSNADFGRPDHALYARAAGFDRRRAAEVFLARAAKDDDFAWNADVVDLMGALLAERTFPVLRKLWGQVGLDESILPVLAKQPAPADRDKFVAGLGSPQQATVGLCLDALEKLPGQLDGAGVLALLRAAQSAGESPQEKALRGRLGAFLQRATGQKLAVSDRPAWSTWFATTYPTLAPRLDGPDGVDVRAWRQRLAAINWAAGEPTRGRQIFTKASCAGCHSGSQALGPDLAGITGRFSRDDLFTAILQPSRDISARYRTTLLATDDGKAYQGLLIYDAVDGVILQTGAAATMRIPGAKIAGRRMSDVSLMPAGLLEKMTEGEIADLYAYLRELRSEPRP